MHCWLLDAVGAVMQGFVVDQEGFYRFHCITQSTHTHKRVVVVTVKQTRERVAVLYPNNQQEQKSLWFHIHCVVFVFAHRILANPNNNITIVLCNVCISLCKLPLIRFNHYYSLFYICPSFIVGVGLVAILKSISRTWTN